jgi:large subunit ribosomal protein L29
MKASQLREMSKDDLLLEERELREQLFRLRFQTATGQLESANRINGVRKDLARVKTVIREMERAQKVDREVERLEK